MIMEPVSSGSIKSVGYDPVERVMHVQFSGSGTYAYADVPPEAHHALMKADSIGKHFCGEIKPKFKATKL